MSERASRENSVGDTDAAVLARRVESSATAIATVTSGQVPVTALQRIAALALALDLLATAGRHGVTRADLDGVVTLAGAAVDAILARDRRGSTSGRASLPSLPTLDRRAGPLNTKALARWLGCGVGFEGCGDGFELGEGRGEVFDDLAGDDLGCWEVFHVLE